MRACPPAAGERRGLLLLAEGERHLVASHDELRFRDLLLRIGFALLREGNELPLTLQGFRFLLRIVLSTGNGSECKRTQGSDGKAGHDAPVGWGLRGGAMPHRNRGTSCFATSFQNPHAKPKWIATNTSGMRNPTPRGGRRPTTTPAASSTAT